jgi:hypothetical protein
MALHLGVIGDGLPGECLFADEAPAHVLTDDNEYLASPVGMGDPFAALTFAVRDHIE